MAAYLTKEDAATRLLDRYGITVVLADGDVDAASDELDGMTPFVGSRYSDDTTVQARQFPRSITLPGDTENVVPDRPLNWVSLTAAQFALDEEPAITSEGAGGASRSYANPKVSRIEKLKTALHIEDYLQRVGVRV